AFQRKLLSHRGRGLPDQDTLGLRLVPAARQPKCVRTKWQQAQINEPQTVPLCARWQVEISLSERAEKPLHVVVAVLSADGNTVELPGRGGSLYLTPGERHVFGADKTFIGLPPLDSRDRVIAFGVQVQDTSDRGASPDVLSRLIAVSPGPSQLPPHTMSVVNVRVLANPPFLPATGRQIRPREYTIADFDVRPYLPADTGSALYRVLRTADDLARAAGDDGIPYRQHDWSLDSDAANLARGIDCSRSIWFAFTRSGLKYNNDNRYLYTGAMIGADSAMQDHFDLCPANEPYRLGDVLVYRSDTRGDGHTVMVIDPEKRISWGSMGWDGNPRDSGGTVSADTGVEYQRIKYKPDWARWDRRDMTLRACWRYRDFRDHAEQDVLSPRVCSEAVCPLPTPTSQ
ncbi:MAG: caspase family protein, partial [Pseudomonadota bacterium]